MPARLILICHAATEATRLGRFPADEDADPAALPGSATVVMAGRWLSAPETRARATALALGARDVETDPALRDWDLGTWRGRSLAEVAEGGAADLARWRAEPSFAPHGGESLAALFDRVGGVLAAAAERGGRIAAVTHPAVLRAAVATALGAGTSVFWRIDAAPLARARLSHDGRRWVLQALVPAGSEEAS